MLFCILFSKEEKQLLKLHAAISLLHNCRELSTDFASWSGQTWDKKLDHREFLVCLLAPLSL